MTLTVYGIKNCDTMKRTFAWLQDQGVDYGFHDYKRAGIDEARLRTWTQQVGWQTLLNTRGTTWRGLTETERAEIDETKALTLMAAHPSLIKRPVVERSGRIWVGFDPEVLARAIRL
ncbi:MAG: ArsC family reductase [Betaproteobacteria bacterium]|nr:ArsC family reductase [Betaproteobacteria bacterium]